MTTTPDQATVDEINQLAGAVVNLAVHERRATHGEVLPLVEVWAAQLLLDRALELRAAAMVRASAAGHTHQEIADAVGWENRQTVQEWFRRRRPTGMGAGAPKECPGQASLLG